MPNALPERQSQPFKRNPLHFLKILDTRFQLTVLGVFLLFVGEILFLAIWSATGAMSDLRVVMSSEVAPASYELVKSIFRRHFDWFLLGGLVLSILHSVIWMIVSNRVAGPLTRIRRELSRFAQGTEGSSMKFRKGDYFPELGGIIERVVSASESGKGAGREEE